MDMGRGEERGRCMERVTWKLALPYVKQIANGCMAQERKEKDYQYFLAYVLNASYS